MWRPLPSAGHSVADGGASGAFRAAATAEGSGRHKAWVFSLPLTAIDDHVARTRRAEHGFFSERAELRRDRGRDVALIKNHRIRLGEDLVDMLRRSAQLDRLSPARQIQLVPARPRLTARDHARMRIAADEARGSDRRTRLVLEKTNAPQIPDQRDREERDRDIAFHSCEPNRSKNRKEGNHALQIAHFL